MTQVVKTHARRHWMKAWAGIVSVALVAAVALSMVPVEASINTDGMLSIGLQQITAQTTGGGEYRIGDEVVDRRGQSSKTWYLGDNQYRFVTTSFLHYDDGSGNWQDINNELVAAQAPWDWEMTQDAYTARVLEDFTYGQVLQWEHQGSTVAFQPMELQWTNDYEQIQSISMPQSGALSVTNTPMQLLTDVETGYQKGVIRWDNAYGTGRHFWWECNTGSLAKYLQLDEQPPAPPQYIIDGGNPVLRLSLVFDPSSELDIYVNGELWDRKTKKQTFGAIEFRVDGEMLWWFNPAVYWDSSEDEEREQALTTLRRTGGNLWVDVHVPYEWLQTALYPVTIDPTLTVQPSSKDNMLFEGNKTNNYGTHTYFFVGDRSDQTYRPIIEFGISGVPSGATIDSASLELYYAACLDTNADGKTVWAYKLTRTDWHETQSTWNIYKTDNNWTTAGGDYVTSSPSGGSTTFPSAAGAWMTWNVKGIVEDAISNEWTVAEFLLRFATEGQASGYSRPYWRSKEYTTDTDLQPKLVIEYTEAATDPEISNTPGSYDFGTIPVNTTAQTALDHFTITNTGSVTVDITIQGTDLQAEWQDIEQLWTSGTLDTQVTGDMVRNIVRLGDYLYGVTNSGKQLAVFDVSNPNSPVKKSQVSMTRGGIDIRAKQVGSSTYLFVSSAFPTNAGGVDVWDVTDPEVPVEDNFIDLSGNCHGMFLVGDYLYVTMHGTAYKLQIVDVSDPTDPSLLGSVSDSNKLRGAHDVHVDGNYAYVANYLSTGEGQYGFAVVDVSNKNSPSIAAYTDEEGSNSHIIKKGNYVYIGGHDAPHGLKIYDVATPSSPVLKSHSFGGDYYAFGYWMTFHGDYLACGGRTSAVTADSDGIIALVDVSDPEAPSIADVEIVSSLYTGCVLSADDRIWASLQDKSGSNSIWSIQSFRAAEAPALTWTLANDADPDANIYGLKAGLDGADYTIIVKKAEAYNTLKSGLAAAATQKWGLKLWMPTTITNYDNQEMSATITLVASASS